MTGEPADADVAKDIFVAGDVRVLVLPADGAPLASERDATDIIGGLFGLDVDLVAIPVERLAPDFFRLRNGKAGAFIQKLVTYRLRIAFLGDLSAEIAASDALRDFVRESNRGRHVTFAADADDLTQRLGGDGGG